DERSQLDAGDELDVGKVEQQVALPQAVGQTYQFPGEHVLHIPLLTGSERDDLHASTLFDFGLRTRTRTHEQPPSTKSSGVRRQCSPGRGFGRNRMRRTRISIPSGPSASASGSLMGRADARGRGGRAGGSGWQPLCAFAEDSDQLLVLSPGL